jgi:hypothetical protein
MARKCKAKVHAPRQEADNVAAEQEILETYGLEVGETIRYRHKDSEDRWNTAKVMGSNSDLSIECYDEGFRSFLPGGHMDLQKQKDKPRGGKMWVSFP